jgi:hypothetical protein
MADNDYSMTGEQCQNHSVQVNRKQVRFADLHNLVEHVNCTEKSDEERKNTWWSLDEICFMSTDALLWAEESKRSKAVIESLDHALREARRAVVYQNPQMFLHNQSLCLWCQYGHSRRGLERIASPLHETTRSNTINTFRKRIVKLSQLSADAEEIHLASEKGSLSSTIFARMIGIADAQAALTPFPVPTRKHLSKTTVKSCNSISISSTLAPGELFRGCG